VVTLRKSFSFALTVLLFQAGYGAVFASTQQDEEARRIARVKAAVDKRGVGEKAGVKIKLRDNTVVKGYIYQTGEENFVVRDAKTGKSETIAYRDVAQVKGKGLSTGAKIGIGAAIGSCATLAVLAIAIAIAWD